MEKEVEFKIGDETLRGRLFVPKDTGHFPGVIFFHGSGGVGEMFFEFAKRLSKKGYITLAFNYRGAGSSDGEFEEQTISNGIEDAKAAIDYFLSLKNLDKNRVALIGGSFGGFLAALSSNLARFKSIVLVGPAAFSPKKYNTQRDADEELRSGFKESQSYKEIEKFNGALLVAISEFEEVLPSGMAEEYFEKANGTPKKEKYVVRGATHRIKLNPVSKEGLFSKIIEWFAETL